MCIIMHHSMPADLCGHVACISSQSKVVTVHQCIQIGPRADTREHSVGNVERF